LDSSRRLQASTLTSECCLVGGVVMGWEGAPTGGGEGGGVLATSTCECWGMQHHSIMVSSFRSFSKCTALPADPPLRHDSPAAAADPGPGSASDVLRKAASSPYVLYGELAAWDKGPADDKLTHTVSPQRPAHPPHLAVMHCTYLFLVSAPPPLPPHPHPQAH
jgi:hypothetical protein